MSVHLYFKSGTPSFIVLHRCVFYKPKARPTSKKMMTFRFIAIRSYSGRNPGVEPAVSPRYVCIWLESWDFFPPFSLSTPFFYFFLPFSSCSVWHYWCDCSSFFLFPPSFASAVHNRFRGNKRIKYLFHSHFINNTGSLLSTPPGNEKHHRRTFVTAEWWIHDD